jgi:hypothetical protein
LHKTSHRMTYTEIIEENPMGYLSTTRQTAVCLFSLVVLGLGCSENESGSVESDGEKDTATVNAGTDTDSGEDGDADSDSVSLRDTLAGSDSDSVEEGPDLAVEILENDIILENQVVTKTIQTVLEVTWRQYTAADQVWLRFTFENDEWYESPKKPGSVGVHREVVLGVPGETDVAIQVMSLGGGDEEVLYETVGKTGSVPDSVPQATILDYIPTLASPHRWMIASVENTPSETEYYAGPFCILIIDRKGRVVWYYLDQAWNPCMAFPRIAPDGSHIAIDRSARSGENQRSVVRTTLDLEQFEEYVTPRMADGMTLTDDGSIIFASTAGLHELLPDGTLRQIWDCPKWAEETDAHSVTPRGFLGCYPNTVNWNPLNDSVLMSYPDGSTVVEVSRETGDVIAYYGKVPGGWDFVPTRNELECVHGANITSDGTLLVSVRGVPGSGFPSEPVPHFFVEFELDRTNRIATEIWMYGEGIDDFPKAKGEAYRVPGGNTLVNYGTGGIIREVTQDGQTAWHVKYDADFENDYNNKMVGHTILIDDLYALTKGW